MDRRIEFCVDSVVQAGRYFGRNYFDTLTPPGTKEHFSDGLEYDSCVLGRNESTDIPLGTLFTGIHLIRFVDGDHPDRFESAVCNTTALTLTAIEWYGRNIDVVPAGHTARLTMKGVGLQALVNALLDASEHEYVSIVAG